MSLIKSQVKLEKTFFLADLIIFIFIFGAFWALLKIAQRWGAPVQPLVEISLSPWSLPKYTLFSLSRGFVAYFLSLIFTIIYGYVAAHNKKAEKIMIPILDILQSIPVLGFLPGLVISFISIFPHWNIGLELACILMIFSGQVWNMTFSFYSSLKSIPQDLIDTVKVWKFGRLEKLLRLELPYASIGLIWN
ncbi:MAG TPA: ABC transporter permease, partial [Elusimicrobia bacterium]|nr:ABC transporter permease [Elusimicrobiota bacterium]